MGSKLNDHGSIGQVAFKGYHMCYPDWGNASGIYIPQCPTQTGTYMYMYMCDYLPAGSKLLMH